jgi:hypothetical protein
MVYDEGFQVKINDEIFLAFSKYRTINNKVMIYFLMITFINFSNKFFNLKIPKDDDDE